MVQEGCLRPSRSELPGWKPLAPLQLKLGCYACRVGNAWWCIRATVEDSAPWKVSRESRPSNATQGGIARTETCGSRSPEPVEKPDTNWILWPLGRGVGESVVRLGRRGREQPARSSTGSLEIQPGVPIWSIPLGVDQKDSGSSAGRPVRGERGRPGRADNTGVYVALVPAGPARVWDADRGVAPEKHSARQRDQQPRIPDNQCLEKNRPGRSPFREPNTAAEPRTDSGHGFIRSPRHHVGAKKR